MSLVVSLAVLSGIYLIGTLISKATGGRVPSALATIPIMFIMFWTGLLSAEDISASNLPAVYAIMMALVLVNVGTTFDAKMLLKEKKIVAICVASLAGCGVLVLTIGSLIFGRDLAFASYPALAGGLVATALMQEAALAKGLTEVAAIVLLVLTIQQWVSMPVISNTVRVEAKKLLNDFHGGAAAEKGPAAEKIQVPQQIKLIDRLPAKYDSMYLHFFLCSLFSALAAWIASYTSPISRGILGTALIGIIVGVIARALGLIAKDPLAKINLMPFFMFAMIMSMRSSLATLSLSALLASLLPIAGLIILGGIGLCLCAVIVGKFVGISIPMAICIGIQAYSGYPLNYQIALETIEAVASGPEEIEYLKDQIMPKVVIGGVVSVSISSVIIGAIFVNLL